MEALADIIATITAISFDVPVYVGLSPLCMISSQLYQHVLGISIDETVLLVAALLLVWTASAWSLLHLIRQRTCKEIFFYQFACFITVVSFILIGVTYSMLRRSNLLEEVYAKILTSLTVIYIAQKWKVKDQGVYGNVCNICFNETSHNDCMILKCGHLFHEGCLWNWIYVKQSCPTCLQCIS